MPVAFIDWDSAGPVDPLADLAAAVWTLRAAGTAPPAL
jgi:aminoglycoside phosphotransferase (APT) family kinase protein